MKKVEFVRVKAELSGYGFGKGIKSSFDSVEEIIKERIMDGLLKAMYLLRQEVLVILKHYLSFSNEMSNKFFRLESIESAN